jgi:hypothetical protein
MERGQYAYLTLVIGGQENDQLRRKAIETLDRFEQTNRNVLETWRGMAKDAQGVDELLTGLVSGG